MSSSRWTASLNFQAQRTVSSSRAEVLTAVAEAGATPGDYTVSVESLARAHQQMSQSYADLDATTLGTGTLTLTVPSSESSKYPAPQLRTP